MESDPSHSAHGGSAGAGGGTISCVVDTDRHPRFAVEAFRWYATLTGLAGVSAADLRVNVVGSRPSHVLDRLRDRGVTVTRIAAFDPRHPPCNKIGGALALSGEVGGELCVLTDSDVVFFEDPRSIRLPAGCVGMRPVDLERPTIDVLRDIFATAGVPEPPTVAVGWQPGAITLAGNGNGGFYLIPAPMLDDVSRAWGRWSTWLLEANLLPREGDRVLCVDQVAMALALAGEGIGVFHLDPRWNLPTHIPTVDPPRAAMLHYHRETSPDDAILPTGTAAIDTLIEEANAATARAWTAGQISSATSSRASSAPETERSVGVYVLGMHRSGTSATTRLIHLLGVPINVPDDWLKPQPDNPTGFWESTALLDFNDELLATLGGDYANPPALPNGWQKAGRLEPDYARARQIFPTLFPTAQWVWKDPRTCLTFPFWRRAIDAAPVVVLAYRNPLEVARSLQSRNGMSEEHALALWERYVISSLREARGLPTFVAGYDHMMRDPVGWCSEVGRFLSAHGVTTAPEASWRDEVEAFVDQSLRHSAHSTSDVRDHPVAARLLPLLTFLEEAQGAHHRFTPPPTVCRESDDAARHLQVSRRAGTVTVVEPRQISVVIPVCNDGHHLRDALASVAAQTRLPLETIIINADSTDDSGTIARSLAAGIPGLSSLVLDAGPGGLPAARNAAVRLCRGDYVQMLAATDRLDARFLERCAQLLDARPDISIAYGDHQNVGGNGDRHSPGPYDLFALTRRDQIGDVAMLRRRAFDAAGGYADLAPYESWDLWLTCAERGLAGGHVADALTHRLVGAADTRGGQPDERHVKARIVLNHPRLYSTEEVEWAAGVRANDPAARGLENAPGAIPRLGGIPPWWSGERIPGLRSHVLLVVADELVSDPALASILCRVRAEHDVSILLANGADADGTLLEGLEDVLAAHGLDGPEGPDLVATALAPALLAQQADAVLSLTSPPPPYSGLRRRDPATIVALPSGAPVAA